MADAVVGGFTQPPIVFLDGTGDPVVAPDESTTGGLGPTEFDNQPVDSFLGAVGIPVSNVESQIDGLGPVEFDNQPVDSFLGASGPDPVDNAEVFETDPALNFNTTGRDVAFGSNSPEPPVNSPPISRLVAGGVINVG